MAFHLAFIVNLVFITLISVSPSRAQSTTTCQNDISKIGNDMSQAICDNGGGGNANGTGTIFLPDQEPMRRKRQNGQSQNFSLLIQEYPYQISPYFKPAAVLRACTGSIVTTYDTEDANLNGRGQTVVSQRQSCNSTGPIELFSGLGNSVQVVEEDIFFDGWVIHITSGFFTLPTLLSSTLRTIGDTSLFANATASGLSAFDFVPSITAFIPSDSAFATALRCGQDSTINILALLRANIVQGSVIYSPLLVDGAFFQSIDGNEITVSVSNGTKYVNGARIVQEDIVIQNGVVHIVDQLVSNTGLQCPPNQTTSTNINFVTTTQTTTVTTATCPTATTVNITNTMLVTAFLTVTNSTTITTTPTTTLTTIIMTPTTTLTTIITTPTATLTTIATTPTITLTTTITIQTTTILTIMTPTTTILTSTTLTTTTTSSCPLPTTSTPSTTTSTPSTTTSTPSTTNRPPQSIHQTIYISSGSTSSTAPCPTSEISNQSHGYGPGVASKVSSW